MKKMEEILIGECYYPILMDLNVLEHIQEEYGTIGAWELELKGWHFKKDEDGNQIYNKNGSPVMYKTVPSIRAIRTVLPWMINEGIAVNAEMHGRPYDEIPDVQILCKCEIDYRELAEIIMKEFARCFSAKKVCRGKKETAMRRR